MALSKRTRFEVFKRDRFTCQYCGKRPPDVVLEVDHVVPKCQDGKDDEANLTTSCMDCNRGKAGVGLGEVRPAVDEMELMAAIQEMSERAVLLKHRSEAERLEREAITSTVAQVRRAWEESVGCEEAFQDASVRMFVRRLPIEQIYEAVDRTMMATGRKRMYCDTAFRYFCGVCWGMIRASEKESE